jgi:ABC-type multidrug transport system ATPase subunit
VTAALSVTALTKRYRRRGKPALDGLTAAFPRGALCGLVGPNGAGKTTLFSIVCGFLRADAGQVDLLGGGPFDAFRLKRRLGVLPQDAALDERLTSREFLRYMALLAGMARRDAWHAADRALDDVDLRGRADDRIGTLSHGMRRRLSTASALIGSPELVLLDEPTAGLDPEQALALRTVLRARRGRGTLVVSSHNLDELERICDEVVLIREGRCVGAGPVAELTDRGCRARWTLGPGVDAALLDTLRGLPGQRFDWEEPTLTQRAGSEAELDAASLQVATLLARWAVPIRGLSRGTTLEESFLATGQPPVSGLDT